MSKELDQDCVKITVDFLCSKKLRVSYPGQSNNLKQGCSKFTALYTN